MIRTVVMISGFLIFAGLPKALATTDLFECRAKIVDLKTNDSAESVGTAAGYRMVTLNTVPSDTEITYAEAKTSLRLNNKKTSYKVDLHLRYNFATRPIANLTEARQQVCNQVFLEGCRNGKCSAATNLCVVVPDPFNPNYGWSQTSLSQNIPVFNEQLLQPVDTVIPLSPNDPDGGHVTVSCKFQGTYL